MLTQPKFNITMSTVTLTPVLNQKMSINVFFLLRTESTIIIVKLKSMIVVAKAMMLHMLSLSTNSGIRLVKSKFNLKINQSDKWDLSFAWLKSSTTVLFIWAIRTVRKAITWPLMQDTCTLVPTHFFCHWITYCVTSLFIRVVKAVIYLITKFKSVYPHAIVTSSVPRPPSWKNNMKLIRYEMPRSVAPYKNHKNYEIDPHYYNYFYEPSVVPLSKTLHSLCCWLTSHKL